MMALHSEYLGLPSNPMNSLQDCMVINPGLDQHNLGFDFDCFLHLQNASLRLWVQQQRNQQLGVLDSYVRCVLRQKEEELLQARERAMVLQHFLRRAEMEREWCQKLAKEKEAMVVHLSQEVKVKVKVNEDAHSICCATEEEENNSKKMACKSCNTRASSVLFLPCRHLCSCNTCEIFLTSCPVCNSVKDATMEVFFV